MTNLKKESYLDEDGDKLVDYNDVNMVDKEPCHFEPLINTRDKFISEQIFELKRLLKDIETHYFNWTCNCKNCMDIKKRIKEILK